MSSDEAYEAGVDRLFARLAQGDKRASAILSFHSAVQQELLHTLGRLVPRAQELKGLGYRNLVQVLTAFADDEHFERMSRLRTALLALNDLRNALAHGEVREKIDAFEARLLAVTSKEGDTDPDLALASGHIFTELLMISSEA